MKKVFVIRSTDEEQLGQVLQKTLARPDDRPAHHADHLVDGTTQSGTGATNTLQLSTGPGTLSDVFRDPHMSPLIETVGRASTCARD